MKPFGMIRRLRTAVLVLTLAAGAAALPSFAQADSQANPPAPVSAAPSGGGGWGLWGLLGLLGLIGLRGARRGVLYRSEPGDTSRTRAA
jgi:hypothetical protein